MVKVLVVENSVDRYRATSSILNVIYGCKIANRDRGINGSVLNVDNLEEYVNELLNGVIDCDIIFIRSEIVRGSPGSGHELAKRLQPLRNRGVALVLMGYKYVEIMGYMIIVFRKRMRLELKNIMNIGNQLVGL